MLKAGLRHRHNFKRGDKVTCLFEVEAYYSNYAGNPKWVFKPGMEATVVCISPKVQIVYGPPIYDGFDERVVIDYIDPADGVTRRASLNFCNIARVTDGQESGQGSPQSGTQDGKA